MPDYRSIQRRSVVAFVFVASACTTATSITGISGPIPPSALTARQTAFLDTVEHRTFNWFCEQTDPNNGLTPARWPTKSFPSIAAGGLALTAYPVGIERGYVTRADAAQRTLNTLRFLYNAPQGPQPANVTGYKGFFYHFLDMQTGYRFQQVELSTIDTSLLLGGVLFCQSYFTGANGTESAIRAYADSIYLRIDWTWAVHSPPVVSMGWHPESGFINSDWKGYDEGMIVYVLALGSPTHTIDASSWTEWTKTYNWATFYGQTHVNFAPLFGHEYSHVWIDFRGIQDAYMHGQGIDYFENSRRATYAHRAYAIANPMAWTGYSSQIWGLTASDGPANATVVLNGRPRQFHTYWARGVSQFESNDDGTIAPTAAGGAVAFAPEIAIPALLAMRETYGSHLFSAYGFRDAFNPTFTTTSVPVERGSVDPTLGWFDVDYLGIDQGPIIAMIENYRTGLIWRLMRGNTHIVQGLCRAGFSGGWIAGKCP